MTTQCPTSIFFTTEVARSIQIKEIPKRGGKYLKVIYLNMVVFNAKMPTNYMTTHLIERINTKKHRKTFSDLSESHTSLRKLMVLHDLPSLTNQIAFDQRDLHSTS